MQKIILFFTLFMMAVMGKAQSADWAMVVAGTQQKILMEKVAFLLASDQSSVFTIVCTDGTMVSEVSSVSFEQVDPTGISQSKRTEAPRLLQVGNTLRLSGLASGMQISLLTTDGREVMTQIAGDGEVQMNISSLPSAVYLLQAGRTVIKIMKK